MAYFNLVSVSQVQMHYSVLFPKPSCADPEGKTGGPDTPLKIHKNIGFFSNTGPNPLKNHKATKPEFNVGPSSARQRNANGVSLAGQ